MAKYCEKYLYICDDFTSPLLASVVELADTPKYPFKTR